MTTARGLHAAPPRSVHRRRALLLALLPASLTTAAASAHAQGFAVDEQAPSGLALAGALTAVPGDASALFYNPAGLALQPDTGLLVGGTLRVPALRVTTPDGTIAEVEPVRRLLPTLFLSGRVGERLVVGLGIYAPDDALASFAGAARDGQPQPFPGRFVASLLALRTVAVSPALSLRVLPGVALGAGLDVVLGSLELSRSLLLGGSEATLQLGAVGDALTAHVGVQAEVLPARLAVGLAFHGGATLAFDGRARFQAPPGVDAPRDQAAATRLPLPHRVSLGVALRPSATTQLALELRHTLASDVRELRVTFPGAPALAQPPEVVTTLAWRDVTSVRLGVSWEAYPGLSLRAGVGYDPSPVGAATLTPLFAGGDRLLVGAGLAYALPEGGARGLGLELGYLAGLSAERTSTDPALPGATFALRTHQLGLALAYRWSPAAR